MSWDIDLVINTGIKDKMVENVGNYTWNVSPMYTEALGYTLSELDGEKAKSVVGELQQGYMRMLDNPQKYKKMNPPNGWGDYEGALKYLRDLIVACQENPDCKIDII